MWHSNFSFFYKEKAQEGSGQCQVKQEDQGGEGWRVRFGNQE